MKGSMASKSENDAWRAKGCCPAMNGSRARSIRRCPRPRSDSGQTGRTREKGSVGTVMSERIRGVEALRPRPLVVLHPVVDGLELVAVDPVHPLPPFITHIHQPHLPQHAQVF